MPSLLDLFRNDVGLDLDANDSQVAIQHGPFGNMTSNQAIVLHTIKEPHYTHLIKDAALHARRDVDSGEEKDVKVEALAVDWMAVKLGLSVLPHLDVKGYVLAQTNPSAAHSVEDTVAHARRLVRLYVRSGIARDRVCIKVPSTLSGLRACKVLREEHQINTLATAVFCVEQSLAAAEYAGCIFTSPYVNPLYVHFEQGMHVHSENPIRDVKGMKVTMEVQRQLRTRKLSTQIIGASLVTLEEAVALSGVDRVTLSPGMLDKMAKQQDTAYFRAIRADSITACSPEYHQDSDLAPDMHYPVDEPATDLRKALERPEVKDLIDDALKWFGGAERDLLELAEKSLAELN